MIAQNHYHHHHQPASQQLLHQLSLSGSSCSCAYQIEFLSLFYHLLWAVGNCCESAPSYYSPAPTAPAAQDQGSAGAAGLSPRASTWEVSTAMAGRHWLQGSWRWVPHLSSSCLLHFLAPSSSLDSALTPWRDPEVEKYFVSRKQFHIQSSPAPNVSRF